MQEKFKDKVIEFVNLFAPNLWGHFKDWVFGVCDEACRKKRGRKCEGNGWWWNKEVKDPISKKKDVDKMMCWNSTEENIKMYKSM